jgi:hypothetical protein
MYAFVKKQAATFLKKDASVCSVALSLSLFSFGILKVA